jgi:hypothetical protein
MGLFRRRSRPPSPPRIAISLPDPVEQIVMLRTMIDRLTDVVLSLCGDVRTLRVDLAVLRPETAGNAAALLHPAAVAPPARIADVIGEATELQRVFDKLHEQSDALWFEKQWLQAQISVAWSGVPLPGHPSVT